MGGLRTGDSCGSRHVPPLHQLPATGPSNPVRLRAYVRVRRPNELRRPNERPKGKGKGKGAEEGESKR